MWDWTDHEHLSSEKERIDEDKLNEKGRWPLKEREREKKIRINERNSEDQCKKDTRTCER